ncbi:putative disease resistance RPP13-like protein 3 [Forsythia ovata]|uniref:Disease resistance RPP13-like protein 3 n=1 Tax=Forsythia ovata TaxID=205694 RepID=A0ABD1TRY5_9LAMI
MRFLNENESWNLLRQRIFGEGYCHPKLEEIGNKIARNCLGLPLAIVVIAGLLSKVKKTQYWENVAENVSSIVTKNEEKFMEILSLSYSHLPHHLKACFLYMGAFPEDSEIPVSKLISLWAAEGFTEQSKTKCSEEVGEEYLQDLIDRSLILVCKRSSSGKIKTCSIHDLLRDLCIRQALSENFLHVAKSYTDLRQAIKTVCRLSIDPYVLFLPETRYTMGSMSLVQTLLCTGTYLINHQVSVDLGFRLMRVLDVVVINFFEFPMEIIELFNLRYLGFTYRGQLPKSISKLLNLETIVHHNWTFGQCPSLPQEIWTMPRLRHLYLTPNFLPDPPTAQIDEENSVRLEHLQTLSEVRGFVCKEEVLERIPNLKKLEISYDPVSSPEGWLYYHLENLVNLHNLETLKLLVKDPPMSRDISPPILAFPPKLKNLTLSGCRIPWEDMTIVGTLPNLEVLKLRNYAFQGAEWETIDGEFCELKFLLIEKTDLVQWTAERTHFPRLERLILKECFRLKEVPSGIGEIDTLNIIELVDCRYSVEASAKQIKEEQESFGNDTLEVRVKSRRTFEDKFYTRILR